MKSSTAESSRNIPEAEVEYLLLDQTGLEMPCETGTQTFLDLHALHKPHHCF